MPLMANASVGAGTMPTGGADGDNAVLASQITPNGQQAGGSPAGTTSGQQGGGGTTQWMPVFQIGTGNPGVPNDARGLISGAGAGATQVGQQQATAQAATSATQAALAANTPATTSSGSATGSDSTSGGSASSIAGGGSQGNASTGSTDDGSDGWPQQAPLPGDNAGAVNSPYNNLPPADG